MDWYSTSRRPHTMKHILDVVVTQSDCPVTDVRIESLTIYDHSFITTSIDLRFSHSGTASFLDGINGTTSTVTSSPTTSVNWNCCAVHRQTSPAWSPATTTLYSHFLTNTHRSLRSNSVHRSMLRDTIITAIKPRLLHVVWNVFIDVTRRIPAGKLGVVSPGYCVRCCT